MKDILRLQAEVAVEIAETVQGEFGDDSFQDVERIAEVNPEAYRVFVLGLSELEQGTTEGMTAALAHFDRSATLDPGYAQPLIWRAGTHLKLASDLDSIPVDVLGQVQADLEQADQLGGAEDEVAAATAILLDQLGAEWSATGTQVGGGVKGSVHWSDAFVDHVPPDSLQSRRLIGSTRIGRLFSRPSPLADAMVLLESGLLDSATVMFARILETDPGLRRAWDGLEEAHLRRGRYSEAAEVRERYALATDTEAEQMLTALRRLRASINNGDPASYWRWRQGYTVAKQARGQHVPAAELAVTAMGMGDREAALGHLEIAVAKRDPDLASLTSNPLWDPLRGDERFRKTLRNIRGGRSDRDGTGGAAAVTIGRATGSGCVERAAGPACRGAAELAPLRTAEANQIGHRQPREPAVRVSGAAPQWTTTDSERTRS